MNTIGKSPPRYMVAAGVNGDVYIYNQCNWGCVVVLQWKWQQWGLVLHICSQCLATETWPHHHITITLFSSTVTSTPRTDTGGIIKPKAMGVSHWNRDTVFYFVPPSIHANSKARRGCQQVTWQSVCSAYQSSLSQLVSLRQIEVQH